MQTGVSDILLTWYVLQQSHLEDNRHGPHNDILPQSDLPCQRANRQGQHRHPLRGRSSASSATACHKTFTARKGTVFYRLRTSAETVRLVVTLLAHGCPLQAIVAAFGL